MTLTSDIVKEKLRELIKKVSLYGKVVILIDEYDKPVIDFLDDLPRAQENRDIFKRFYSVLKDADEYIRLLIVLGVTKFTEVSIFSDLNNLQDITLSPHYGTLVGITHAEMMSNFSLEMAEMRDLNPSIDEDIREWYNGYSWNAIHTVYNPYSLLNFMSDRQFRNYWFQTGTPSFLIEQIKRNRRI